MAPAEYTATGYRVVNATCNAYFDELIRMQNQNAFKSDVTASVQTAMGSILSLASAGDGDTGRATALFGLITSILKSFKDRALMTPYPSETKTLILAALKAYASEAPPSSVESREHAAALVEGYAELCSYSGVTRIARQALAAARPVEQPVGEEPEPADPPIDEPVAEEPEAEKPEAAAGAGVEEPSDPTGGAAPVAPAPWPTLAPTPAPPPPIDGEAKAGGRVKPPSMKIPQIGVR